MSTTPPPDPDAGTDAPRVLLFGHRGAGKSALIGALLQAGETQGETLRGEVVHSSVDLPRIRDSVYNGAKVEPVEPVRRELVSYALRLRPWRVGGKPVGEPMSVILDDCDGKAAEALLEHPEPITRRQLESPLARAVVESDAMALLVDAASTDAELDEAFREFDTFLRVVARAKTEAREVGGFPVFLVLTQCDRLARPGDTVKTWEDRVERRTEAAWKAFDAFLKEAEPDGGDSPYLSFGSVDLTVVAVAVRRPPVAGAPADQPFHVAELFRDCFAEARSHRKRVRSSEKRLRWTVRAALGVLALLLGGLAGIALFPPQGANLGLAEKVRQYSAHEPPAAVRLSEGEIERNRRTLAGFATDPGFRDLDADLRGFVESRLKEIEDYRAYRAKLANAIAPGSTRNLPDLAKVRESLHTDLALPPQYAWQETAAAELRNKWLADCAAIEAVEKSLVEKYSQYDRAATAHMLTRTFDANWLRDLDALVAAGDRPPFPLNEPIPGSYAINQPRGEAVTHSVPYEFDEVYHARRYWEQSRDRLLDLRDLADALGATTGPGRPPPVLMLPEPDGADSAALPSARWAALLRNYPRPPEGYAEWEVGRFPAPARSELAARLKRSFDAGAKHVHKLMKVEDTKEGWKALAATLAQPVFRDWGRLLHLLARLQNAGAADPITELADFLRDLDSKAYELDLRGFELVIPDELTVGLEHVVPVGPLTVTVTKGAGPEVRGTAKFAVGRGESRGKATVYPLTPDGPAKLNYFAGDGLRAELSAKAGASDVKLLWESGATKTFQFDRLAHEPRLTRPTGGTEAAPGVRLVPLPGSVIPKLPALMPAAGVR